MSQQAASDALVCLEPDAVLHARPFKLRFEPQREPGRSNIAPNKPLGLPSTVTCKWYSARRADAALAQAEDAALRRVEELCARGPRDLYARPHLSSHEYGWWSHLSSQFSRGDHGLRDSHWLKTRARLLHHDAVLSGK